MPRTLLPLTADPRDIGAKAAGLGRAGAAGAPVPQGFALSAAAYDEALLAAGGPFPIAPGDPLPALDRARAALASAPLPEGVVDELVAAARTLGADRLSLRSSASEEDHAEASAAGVFESRIGVPATPDALAEALRAIFASAWSPAAYAYLHARGRGPADVRMAVLVHATLTGQRGTVFTRDPSDARSDVLRIEADAPGHSLSVLVPRAAPEREPAYTELARAALRLEAAAGAPLDLEWLRTPEGALFILQQRPISAWSPPPFPALPPDDAVWTLDGEHNPEPLSPAQEGLVARVAVASGLRQTVLAGYLYGSRERAPRPPRLYAPVDLERAFREELAPAMEAALAPLEQAGAAPPALEAALAAYDRFYAVYATLGSSLGRARGALAELLRANDADPRLAAALVAGTPTETTARDQALWEGDLGALAGRWGALAPAWDVAWPTYSEALPARPAPTGPSPEQRRRAAAERARAVEAELLRSLPRMARGALKHLLPWARAAYALGELDDLYFARALRLVRRALLGRGPAPDVFFVPLGAPFDAAVAEKGRAEQQRRRSLVPPPRFAGGRPDYGRAPGTGPILRGLGAGGRARGRVGGGPGEVLVVPTLLPQSTPTLLHAAAVVTDHGGLLSHGATQAREYGLAAVLGTRVATAVLEPGDEVLVDGERGAVYRLSRPSDG